MIYSSASHGQKTNCAEGVKIEISFLLNWQARISCIKNYCRPIRRVVKLYCKSVTNLNNIHCTMHRRKSHNICTFQAQVPVRRIQTKECEKCQLKLLIFIGTRFELVFCKTHLRIFSSIFRLLFLNLNNFLRMEKKKGASFYICVHVYITESMRTLSMFFACIQHRHSES